MELFNSLFNLFDILSGPTSCFIGRNVKFSIKINCFRIYNFSSLSEWHSSELDFTWARFTTRGKKRQPPGKHQKRPQIPQNDDSHGPSLFFPDDEKQNNNTWITQQAMPRCRTRFDGACHWHLRRGCFELERLTSSPLPTNTWGHGLLWWLREIASWEL